MSNYQVRRVSLGKTEHLDELARECGRLYSETLIFYWRTVRHKGVWLKPKHLMRLYTSQHLHAHTADACVQAFFAALDSWRRRRKRDPDARPLYKRKWSFRIEYKCTAMHHQDGTLTLSNGNGNKPLELSWPWPTPKTVVIRWTGTHYEAIATCEAAQASASLSEKVTGIDLGEVHMAVSHDGAQTHILNGNDVGSTNNQKIHQWSHGSVRHKLTGHRRAAWDVSRLARRVLCIAKTYLKR